MDAKSGVGKEGGGLPEDKDRSGKDKANKKRGSQDIFGELDHKKIIREVWAHNLKEEMERIMDLVDDYPFIAMDTEFPGIVARPVGPFRNSQMGLCFCDAEGRLPPGVCVWQFNFKFDLSEDMYARDSIEFLKKSGIDFDRHAKEGIDVMDFAEVLITSAIVLNEDVTWVTFHSGYDYGYLLRLLTCEKLPDKEDEFFELLKTYCPCVYDVRFLMKVFFHLRNNHFDGRLGSPHNSSSRSNNSGHADRSNKYMNHLYGLGSESQPVLPAPSKQRRGASDK